MYKKLSTLVIATTLILPVNQPAHASWFEDGFDLLKRAATYARNNPKAVVDTGLLIAAVSFTAFIVYKSRAEPLGATALEDGIWEDIPFMETRVVAQQARVFTPPKAPKIESISARSPELRQLIADALSRGNRIVGLNSQTSEH